MKFRLMWSALAKVSVIAGMAPYVIADEAFVVAKDQLSWRRLAGSFSRRSGDTLT